MDALESPMTVPDTPTDGDEALYPCKGCGEILEEGKAFELGKSSNGWPAISTQMIRVLLQTLN